MFGFALTALASILFVADPPGALPAYLAMTEGDDAAKRRRTAWRAAFHHFTSTSHCSGTSMIPGRGASAVSAASCGLADAHATAGPIRIY